MSYPNSWVHEEVKLEGLSEDQQVGLDMYMADHPEANFSEHSLVNYVRLAGRCLILEHAACQKTDAHVEPCDCIVWRPSRKYRAPSGEVIIGCWDRCATYGRFDLLRVQT